MIYKKTTDLGLVPALIILGLFIAGLVGWVMNIITLVNSDSFTGMVIARIAGIFVAPLGAVLGYF